MKVIVREIMEIMYDFGEEISESEALDKAARGYYAYESKKTRTQYEVIDENG